MSGNWLSRAAEAAPDRVALVADGAELTYADLESRVRALVPGLFELCGGWPGGRTLALDLPAGTAAVTALHAVWAAGGVPYVVGRRDPPEVRAERLRLSKAVAIVDDAALERVAGLVSEARATAGEASVRGEDDKGDPPSRHAAAGAGPARPALRVFTSGTTAEPRLVELTFANLESSARAVESVLGRTAIERWLCCLPLEHVGGLSIPIRSAVLGTTAVLHDGFDTDRVAAELERGVTGVSLVATMLARLLDAGAPLERARVVLVGGGSVPRDRLLEAAGRGAVVVQTYGLTETASQVTTLEPVEAVDHAGSAGRPLPGTEVRVASHVGDPVGPGEEGEVWVRGPTVAPSAAGSDGWLRTGDLGSLDHEGRLTVTGRRSDLIVTGGENVSPVEVEDALRTHPAVADVAVVGRPDPEWQQAVTALVVLRPGEELDARALREHCRARLAAYKVPKRFESVDSLPRTPSGKLLRRALY